LKDRQSRQFGDLSSRLADSPTLRLTAMFLASDSFNSAGFICSEQIESSSLTGSNDLLKTKSVAPSNRIEDSDHFFSAYEISSSFSELSKNGMPTQEFLNSILLFVSNPMMKSEEFRLSTRIGYWTGFMSTNEIVSDAFSASEHQIDTQKLIESIMCDLSNVLIESRRLAMSISQFVSNGGSRHMRDILRYIYRASLS
jgi:hypothetical protein